MSVTITLPNNIEKQLRDKWGNELPRKTVEALVIEGYRLGDLSVGEVAEVLQISINEADGFLKIRGVYAIKNMEEVEADNAVLEELLVK